MKKYFFICGSIVIIALLIVIIASVYTRKNREKAMIHHEQVKNYAVELLEKADKIKVSTFTGDVFVLDKNDVNHIVSLIKDLEYSDITIDPDEWSEATISTDLNFYENGHLLDIDFGAVYRQDYKYCLICDDEYYYCNAESEELDNYIFEYIHQEKHPLGEWK